MSDIFLVFVLLLVYLALLCPTGMQTMSVDLGKIERDPKPRWKTVVYIVAPRGSSSGV